MSSNLFHRVRRFVRAEFLSSKDFLVRAATIAIVFLIAHVAGLREYTSFLSGTLPSSDMGWQQAAFGGLVYLILYFACVLLVPILVIAATVQCAIHCFLIRRQPRQRSSQQTIPAVAEKLCSNK